MIMLCVCVLMHNVLVHSCAVSQSTSFVQKELGSVLLTRD